MIKIMRTSDSLILHSHFFPTIFILRCVRCCNDFAIRACDV